MHSTRALANSFSREYREYHPKRCIYLFIITLMTHIVVQANTTWEYSAWVNTYNNLMKKIQYKIQHPRVEITHNPFNEYIRSELASWKKHGQETRNISNKAFENLYSILKKHKKMPWNRPDIVGDAAFLWIRNIHQEDLDEFTRALVALARNKPIVNGSMNYFTAFDEKKQKRHAAAYDRALFESTWDIAEKNALTPVYFLEYLRTGAIFDFKTWLFDISAGLEKLKKTKPLTIYNLSFDHVIIPILDEESEKNFYDDKRLPTLFNDNTSRQLLSAVQQLVTSIFGFAYTDVAMKYRLLQLVKESATSDSTLSKVYTLAFLHKNYAETAAIEDPFAQKYGGENPAISSVLGLSKSVSPAGAMLLRLTHATDWIKGRATLFWQKRWQKEGIIQRPLSLKKAFILQLKIERLNEARVILKKTVPSASNDEINSWIDTYLEKDTYTINDIVKVAKEEEKEEEVKEEAISFFEQFFTKSRNFIQSIFLYA